jgi:poly-beta-1,6-N-acetyl-D-glucosamine biosynthesis protein PgaD
MTTHWPPVIGAANVPLWARLRDIALTAAAWLLLAYLLMPMLDALWSETKVLLGLRQSAPAVEWLWLDLRPFLWLIALLSVWMVCYAAVRSWLLKRRIRTTEPSPSLDRAAHVQHLGLTSAEAEKLQQARVMVVEFDADFRASVVGTPEPMQG